MVVVLLFAILAWVALFHDALALAWVFIIASGSFFYLSMKYGRGELE